MELENFKYNLARLKKCDQYWDEMDPVLGGRLCGKCDKTIVDFSNMTFTDIAFFMSNSEVPVCGFYKPEQLKQMTSSTSKLPFVLSLTTLLTTSTISKANRIGNETEQNTSQNKSIQDFSIENGTLKVKQDTDTTYFVGTVQYFDSTKQRNVPVSFATVFIKGSRNGVAANDNGEFKLRYQPTTESGKFYLVISSAGFENKEIEIVYSGQQQFELGTIILEYKNGLTQFWVTIKKRSKLNKFWRKITKPFRRH